MGLEVGDTDEVVGVVDFDFAESCEDGLPEEEGGGLAVRDRGVDVVEVEGAELYVSEVDDGAVGY